MDEQQLQQQIVQLVQAAMQGDQQATQQILQIMLAAQQGDPQATQIALMILQVVLQMQQQQVRAAKFGAKLNYVKQLNGQCPEGYEMAYYKAGGTMQKKCKRCMQQGGEMNNTPKSAVGQFKTEIAKCGKKMKKKACGGNLKKKEIIKGEKGLVTSIDKIQKEQARKAREANQAEGRQAAAYFHQVPSIQNLVKGVYHWAKSKPWLLGENESEKNRYTLTGTAPVPSIGNLGKLANKDLFKMLDAATLKNFLIYLKNGNSSLEKITPSERAELLRLVKGVFKPTPIQPVRMDRTIKDTRRWSGDTPTKDW